MRIMKNYPARELNTIRIGGTIEQVIFAENTDEILSLLEESRQSSEPVIVIGGGSNIIFRDGLIRGRVIVNRDCGSISLSGNDIIADSSVKLSSLVDFCAQNGISGFEFLAGIMGTFGGAVAGNAGAYGCCTGDFIVSARIWDLKKGIILEAERDFFNFSYRYSKARGGRYFILSARLRKPGSSDPAVIHGRIKEILQIRTGKLPPEGTLSAGSFFKNITIPGQQKREAAAKFIDEAGCKGLRVGDAQVSTHHANFIINRGNASFSDLLTLVNNVRQRVKEKSGLELEEEVIYYPGA